MQSATSQTTLTYNKYIYTVESNIHFPDGTIAEIAPQRIQSLVIDYNYDELNMPLVYLTLNIETRILDMLIKDRDGIFIVLTVRKAVENSNSSNIWITYFEDKFTYFTSEDVNKYKDIEYNESNANDEETTNYKSTTLGLMSLNLINTNKHVTPVNGVINGDMQSIVYYTLSHMKSLLIEPFKYNLEKTGVIIPPLNTCAKVISYLNEIETFYDTSYMYFMDFDTTYLLSTSGKATKKLGEVFSDVLISITNQVNLFDKVEGMAEDKTNQVYYVPFSAYEARLSDTHDIEKEFMKLTGVSSDGKVQKTDVFTHDSILSKKTENIRIRNGNERLVRGIEQNIKDQSKIMLVNTTYLDTSILTPNKRYKVECSQVYDETSYNGIYRLSRKREVYLRHDKSYFMSTALLLRKK